MKTPHLAGLGTAGSTWYDHGFYLNGIIGGGYSSYLTRRETIGGAARGDTDGLDYTGTIGAGYEYRVGGLTVGPIAAVQYTTIGLKGFTERGSLAPLHLDDESGSSLLSEVGIRASYAWKVGRAVITPEARAQWLHEYQDSSQGIGASFAENSTASFNVYGPQIGRDSLLLEVGLSAQLSPRTSVFAYYTGDFGAANYTSHSVNGGFRISF
jgi:outer membrane autotransporter protein